MLRLTGLALVVLTLSAGSALAWSERSLPLGASDGAARTTDPDERVQRLTGRNEYGERTESAHRPDGGGWSFSVTPQSQDNRSPLGSMFANPGWSDRRR